MREEQRGVLYTWKINVDALSSEAFSVLRTASMLGNSLIPEDLFECIMKEEADVHEKRFLVFNELVFGSSLLQRTQNGGEKYFETHRLVRFFILVEMEEEPEAWDKTFSQALSSTHSCLETCLQENTVAFDDEPRHHSDAQNAFVPHAYAIVTHYDRTNFSGHKTSLKDECVFAGVHLRWLGRMAEAEEAFETRLELQSKTTESSLMEPSFEDALQTWVIFTEKSTRPSLYTRRLFKLGMTFTAQTQLILPLRSF